MRFGVQLDVNLRSGHAQDRLNIQFPARPAVVVFLVFALAPLASGQQVSGRFYPEKEHYLVGEPIIIDLEVVNKSPKAIELAEFNCAWGRANQFEVDGAPPKKRTELYGCGQKAIAGDCLMGGQDIAAGGRFRERLLLEGNFELDSPGNYHVKARHDFGANSSVVSEFDVSLRAPNPGELEAVYKPFLDDLRGRNLFVQDFAISALTQNPPPFAEAAILKLAESDNPSVATSSIEGLQKLATPATRAKLIEMASMVSPDYYQQPAIQALGEIGNPADCGAMLGIASKNLNYTQAEAYIVAGRICREGAIPTLSGLIGASNSQLLMGVAGGLANTSSRDAVPSLINLLQTSDSSVRRAAADGLATLTHLTSRHGIEDEESAKRAYTDWQRWWAANGSTTPIYSGDQCAAPQPLT